MVCDLLFYPLPETFKKSAHPEKTIHMPPKPETPSNAESLLDELTSKSLPELQEEWFRKNEA